MTNKIASARKSPFGYKAVVNYVEGFSKIPVRKNFATREDAVAYAQRWIDANDSRETGKRSEPVRVAAHPHR